ncbi:MAG: response regulator [Coriobacteriales bacterium]|jgi:CheY-like chemotaxis protein|nr:response regulator [Coriobacteriales bacterium]
MPPHSSPSSVPASPPSASSEPERQSAADTRITPDEDRFKRRFKRVLLKTNAPRMLALCITFVVFQAAMLVLGMLGVLAPPGLEAGTYGLDNGSRVALEGIALAAGVVYALLFAAVVLGFFRRPQTQNLLVQTGLVVLSCLQLALFFVALSGGHPLFYYVVYVLMLGVLPVLPRVQGTAYLCVFSALCLLLFLLVAPPAPATYSASWTAQACIALMAFLAGLAASWLSLGLARAKALMQMQLKQQEREREALIEDSIAWYKEKARTAEAANLAKTRFLTRASHELRTSMNTISGMVFLAEKSENAASRQESLDSIDEASQKLSGIVNSFIDTVKTELDLVGDDLDQQFALMSSDAARPKRRGGHVTAPDLSGFTILIVEDIETNRLVLREYLKDTQALIEEAPNGRVAVEMFAASAENHYSFVFMDLLMPEMNGHDATRAIRKMERADALSVPIVAVSANAFTEDVEASLAAGMDAHLAKPVERATIFRTLIERLT